ncbi:MAG: protein kinase [Chloroflexota bacterium]
MSSLVGRTLGQYEIIDVLGRGGMATVYLGRQASIDRYVAVKVLPPHPGLDEAFKERFQLEAKAIGNLQNPNILPLFDYGTVEDVIYLVMQYVDGGTLEDLIELGPMNVPKVEKLVRSIASGLDYAHGKGVIHRDIKPGNILLQDNHPLLADFGMVKMVSGDANLTGTSIVGTPSYMAPEQGQGLDVDQRVDVYALAAMTYEMLTGKQPFSGATPMQMILAHINDQVPDVRELRPDINENVSNVIKRGMAKQPDLRHTSAGDFAEALSRAIHTNDDSLLSVQKQVPINQTQQSNKSPEQTIAFSTSATQAVSGTDATNPLSASQQVSPSQIIVRDSVNPLVLMGGFGLMALVIVIVAVLLINQNNNANPITPPDLPEIATDSPTDALTEPVVIVPEVETFGEVRFSTEDSFGDRVEVRLQGVTPPTADRDYVAWLINTATDETLNIGRVIVDGVGEGVVTFTDPDGRMLPATYNGVVITLEEDADTTSPAGEVAFSNTLPIEVSTGLNEIFVASENGLGGDSLLNGASTEAQTAAQHAGLAAGASNIGGLRTHAEHTINILEGGEIDYDGSGSGSNPGRGVGVYFFLDEIDAILLAATSAENASVDLQRNAEFIRVCTQNVRGWSDEIIELEIEMIAGETLEEVLDQTERSTQLAEQLRVGFDLNENGIIEAFEGECGLEQIPNFGLQFARIDILEGDVRSE